MTDRRRGFSARQQLRAFAPLLVVWAAGLLVLGVVVARDPGRRAELLLDPTFAGGLPWYVGLVSNLGIVGWCTATVAAAFGAVVARVGGRPSARSFLSGGALLCGLLLLDDLFQLHSAVVNHALGVGKITVVAVYAAGAFAWTASNRSEIARTRWRILAAGGLALAASAAADTVLRSRGGLGLLAEDGPKFLGILAVATYFWLTTGDIVRSVVTQASERRREPVAAGR